MKHKTSGILTTISILLPFILLVVLYIDNSQRQKVKLLMLERLPECRVIYQFGIYVGKEYLTVIETVEVTIEYDDGVWSPVPYSLEKLREHQQTSIENGKLMTQRLQAWPVLRDLMVTPGKEDVFYFYDDGNCLDNNIIVSTLELEKNIYLPAGQISPQIDAPGDGFIRITQKYNDGSAVTMMMPSSILTRILTGEMVYVPMEHVWQPYNVTPAVFNRLTTPAPDYIFSAMTESWPAISETMTYPALWREYSVYITYVQNGVRYGAIVDIDKLEEELKP